MNRYTTYLAGGALLASTALASGTVHAAASVKTGTDLSNNSGTGVAYVAKEVATNLWSSASNSAVNISTSFVILGSNTYAPSSTAVVVTITGAEFDPAFVPVVTSAQLVGGSATATNAITSGILTFSDKIILTSLSVTWTAINFSGLEVKGLNALANAGNSVAISGSVQNSAQTSTYEAITSANILTSKSPITFAFTSASTTASNTTTPGFANFGAATQLTLTAGTIGTTQVTGLSTDLATQISAQIAISTAEIRITHAALSDSSLNFVRLDTGGTTIGSAKSGAAVSSGVATFTLSTGAGNLFDSANVINVELAFKGTATIPLTSGTQTVAVGSLTAKAPTVAAVGTQSGLLGNISRNGLNTSLNMFQNSFNPVKDLIRIANGGANAGSYTIVVSQGDAAGTNPGTAIGTYTGGTIAPNSTVQLFASDIESKASIATPTTYGNYSLAVSATFNGYVQHMTYSPAYGFVGNLSPVRNGNTTGLSSGAINP